MQKTGRKIEKPETDKALPSRVASSIVEVIFLWIGFKRPPMYWIHIVLQVYISKF